MVSVAAHGCRPAIPGPDGWPAGAGVDPQPDRRASGGFAARAVAEAVPGMELGSGQWRRMRHGLPWFDAGAGPRRTYPIASGETQTTQSAGRTRKTKLSGNRYLSDRIEPQRFGSAGIPC